MYEQWGANALVVFATLATVAVCVELHYEGLSRLGRRLATAQGTRRSKVLYAIYGILGLHIAEIWIFGGVIWALLIWPATGQVPGHPAIGLLDAVYLSASTYTTVGYGDLSPVGPIRFLAGTEALTGFVLITWSASFTYLEMERYWRVR